MRAERCSIVDEAGHHGVPLRCGACTRERFVKRAVRKGRISGWRAVQATWGNELHKPQETPSRPLCRWQLAGALAATSSGEEGAEAAGGSGGRATSSGPRGRTGSGLDRGRCGGSAAATGSTAPTVSSGEFAGHVGRSVGRGRSETAQEDRAEESEERRGGRCIGGAADKEYGRGRRGKAPKKIGNTQVTSSNRRPVGWGGREKGEGAEACTQTGRAALSNVGGRSR